MTDRERLIKAIQYESEICFKRVYIHKMEGRLPGPGTLFDHGYEYGALARHDLLMPLLEDLECEIKKRERQLSVAIECLDKYRTLVIDYLRYKEGGTFRLGKHAEDALHLMGAINDKTQAANKGPKGSDQV